MVGARYFTHVFTWLRNTKVQLLRSCVLPHHQHRQSPRLLFTLAQQTINCDPFGHAGQRAALQP